MSLTPTSLKNIPGNMSKKAIATIELARGKGHVQVVFTASHVAVFEHLDPAAHDVERIEQQIAAGKATWISAEARFIYANCSVYEDYADPLHYDTVEAAVSSVEVSELVQRCFIEGMRKVDAIVRCATGVS
jgi:hypothetical protein